MQLPWRAAGGERPLALHGHGHEDEEAGRARAPAALNNLFYSFEFGSVHVAILSSEHDMLKNSTQYRWLQQDLESVDRSVTPWLVFGQHRPFFDSSSASLLPELGIMKRSLEPLMLQYKVDLALFGHIHQVSSTLESIMITACR